MTKPNNSYSVLKKKALKLYSKYIRLKGADENGYNHCYTCGVKKHYKDLDAGHFHHSKLDFDCRNRRPQCTACNRFRHGNLAIFGTRLTQELGKAGMQKLMLEANTTRYSNKDLRDIIEKYKD